jgi:hypothetical protein
MGCRLTALQLENIAHLHATAGRRTIAKGKPAWQAP